MSSVEKGLLVLLKQAYLSVVSGNTRRWKVYRILEKIKLEGLVRALNMPALQILVN